MYKRQLLGNIPFFGPLLFRNTYITTYLGIVILVLSTLVLYRTRFGLRLRSCGAVSYTHLDVYKRQVWGGPA